MRGAAGGFKRFKNGEIRQGSPAVDFLICVFMILLALITVYPVLYIFANSFSDPQEVMKGTVWLWPKGFSVEAYGKVLSSPTFYRSFVNSVLYTLVITFLNLMVSMMCGFGLSRQNLIWQKGIIFFVLLPMWFSAGLIPSFITITRLGLYNTLWAVFLPSALSTYNIILARTFIRRLPAALHEAAQIDGASIPMVFCKIVLPLSKPIMAVLGLYTALAAWNNWFSYVLYLPSHTDLHPLQYFLVKALLWGSAQSELSLDTSFAAAAQRIRGAAVANQLKYAIVIVVTVPIMCAYPFVQKYFVQGVMLGSLKE